MTYFDATLDFAPVAEQNTDPVLPEERFVFELIGLERSAPDQYHKNGGIKWSWRVFYEDGRTPFVFNDEQYIFWRTTNVNAKGVPQMNLGTNAYEWAAALLGKPLGLEETLRPSELRGARMSAFVTWKPKKTKPKEKTIELASLKFLPRTESSNGNGVAARPAPTQVSADATEADVDRALLISKLDKKVKLAVKKNLPNALAYEDALNNVGGADEAQIRMLLNRIQDELDDLE